MSNVWNYRETSWLEGGDLVGYSVEATDGSIGKIDEATNEVDAAHVVVDTGPWIFGKKRLIPAGAITYEQQPPDFSKLIAAYAARGK